MSSGTLTSQSNFSIPSSSQDFSSLIKTICQTYRLTGKFIQYSFNGNQSFRCFSGRTDQFCSFSLFRNYSWTSHCLSGQINCSPKWHFNRWEINRNSFSFQFNGRNETLPQIIIPTYSMIFAFEHLDQNQEHSREREKYVR